jgi:AcrR family transcriptional regulator
VTTSAQPAPTARLGVTDWITAGLELLSEEGIVGVKIQRLCERLGVTKGSFYWHFTDLDAFLGAMAKHYEDGARIFRDRFTDMANKDPQATLDDSSNFLLNRRLAGIERAMRDWARTDARARAAIDASDALSFAAIRQSFELLGFTEVEADVRAKTLFYAGVGFGDVGPIGDTETDPRVQLAVMMELLTRR